MSKRITSKYIPVGKSKVFIVDKNDLFVLDALMHDGSQQKYTNTTKKLKYSEHGGLLDFDKNGLERIIISTRKEYDKRDPDIYFPVVTNDVEDFEFMYHTHPPTPSPGSRSKSGIVYELPSLTDINTFIIAYQEGRTQGSIIVAPEGFYIIRSMVRKLHPDKYNLEEMYHKMLYLNYKCAEKYNFNVTSEIFYKNIITSTKIPIKIKELINKYTNNEITLDYIKRKKDKSGNWTVKKLYLVVIPKEKIIK